MINKIFHECFPSVVQHNVVLYLRSFFTNIPITLEVAQRDLHALLTLHAKDALNAQVDTPSLRGSLRRHCWDSFQGAVAQIHGLAAYVQNPYCFQEWADIVRFTSDIRLTLSSIVGAGSMTLFFALLDVLKPIKDKDPECQ